MHVILDYNKIKHWTRYGIHKWKKKKYKTAGPLSENKRAIVLSRKCFKYVINLRTHETIGLSRNFDGPRIFC